MQKHRGTYKGKFQPTNPKKYRGNVKDITFRSSWELLFAKHCDLNPDIVQWSSEETVIGYYSTADGKNRRYYMDFAVTYKDGTRFLFEVKPYAQTIMPKPHGNKKAGRYEKELYTWTVNVDKWKAAKKFAEERKMQFKILTEKTLRSHFGIKV